MEIEQQNRQATPCQRPESSLHAQVQISAISIDLGCRRSATATA